MIPDYLLLSRLELLNSLWGLMVPAAISPFAIFLMRQFILSIPNSLIKSASVDGASELRIFWSVVLPQVKPALATLGLLTFMSHWNAYLWPLIVLTEKDNRTMPVIFSWFSTQNSAQNITMAAAVLIVLPSCSSSSSSSGGSCAASRSPASSESRTAMTGSISVAIIGAGSAEFAAELMTDLLCTPALPSGTFALVDIDAERLDLARQFGEYLIERTGRDWTVEAAEDRADVLPGCDYVISTIEVAGLDNVGFDYDIPMKYGVDQCIGDTIGPGGLFKALRTIPTWLDILPDIERLARTRWCSTTPTRCR